MGGFHLRVHVPRRLAGPSWLVMLWLLSATTVRGVETVVPDQIEGVCVERFPVEDVIDVLDPPPSNSVGLATMPPHMEYYMFLDEWGWATPESPFIRYVAPEPVATLAAGEFSRTDSGRIRQTLSTCRGDGWTFFFNTLFGRMYYIIIHLVGFCSFDLEWNEEMTRAFPIIGGSDLATIELFPYWKWKFGLTLDADDDEQQLALLDNVCCPPKPNAVADCSGPGTLGQPGPCETISMACGTPTQILACGMWLRQETYIDFGVFLTREPNEQEGQYISYPLGDKYQQTTGYFDMFLDTMAANGITDLFHGPSDSTNNNSGCSNQPNFDIATVLRVVMLYLRAFLQLPVVDECESILDIACVLGGNG